MAFHHSGFGGRLQSQCAGGCHLREQGVGRFGGRSRAAVGDDGWHHSGRRGGGRGNFPAEEGGNGLRRDKINGSLVACLREVFDAGFPYNEHAPCVVGVRTKYSPRIWHGGVHPPGLRLFCAGRGLGQRKRRPPARGGRLGKGRNQTLRALGSADGLMRRTFDMSNDSSPSGRVWRQAPRVKSTAFWGCEPRRTERSVNSHIEHHAARS